MPSPFVQVKKTYQEWPSDSCRARVNPGLLIPNPMLLRIKFRSIFYLSLYPFVWEGMSFKWCHTPSLNQREIKSHNPILSMEVFYCVVQFLAQNKLYLDNREKWSCSCQCWGKKSGMTCSFLFLECLSLVNRSIMTQVKKKKIFF